MSEAVTTLGKISELVSEKIQISELDTDSYVSTDNMLPNLGGIEKASALPSVDKTRVFKNGDVLFSNIRTYFKKVWFADFDGGCSNDVLVFRGNKDVNSRFLYYVLADDNFIDFTVKTSKGTKMPRGDKDAMKQYALNLPPLSEQKAIAHILGTLDDKIELNRKMNKTLEAMAQALFKSWFVDFDPVLDNALAAGNEIPDALKAKAAKRLNSPSGLEGVPAGRGSSLLHTNPELAKLFPSSFAYNETLEKWVPEGWVDGTVGDRYFVKGGFAYKSKDFVETGGVPVVKIKSINSDHTIENSNLSHVKKEVALAKKDFWLEDGDMLMAMTGATVGKFGIVARSKDELVVLNQRVAKFFLKNDDLTSLCLLYCFYNDPKNESYIVNTAEGSAQPNISANQIMATPMIQSSIACVKAFENVAKPIFERIIQNQKETQTLTQLRDTLLPQLISGKVRVPEEMMDKLIS